MKITIDEFINTEYKEYAEYVAFKRALPSLIDSFKDTRRKIFYYMLQSKNKGFMRVSSCGGGISEKCNYHHAETSAQSTIVNMMKNFPSSNNIPYFLAKGAIGSKIMPNAVGAPRYIQVAYNTLMDYVYLDNNLVIENDDIESPEPKYYYPIIPMFLVNGISGIGIGFACNILPRKPKDIIKQIKNILQDKNTKNIEPHYLNCDYDIQHIDSNTYEIAGKIIQKDKLCEITEVPPNISREKIIASLIELQDDKKIKSYSDESKENWLIKVKLSDDIDLLSELKLKKRVTENFTLLDEHNSIRVFKDVRELLEHFVNFRLTIYEKRIKQKITDLQAEIPKLNLLLDLINFIQSENKFDIDDIYKKFDKTYTKALIDNAIQKPLKYFFKASSNQFQSKIQELKKEIKYYNQVTARELYLQDLEILKGKI